MEWNLQYHHHVQRVLDHPDYQMLPVCGKREEKRPSYIVNYGTDSNNIANPTKQIIQNNDSGAVSVYLKKHWIQTNDHHAGLSAGTLLNSRLSLLGQILDVHAMQLSLIKRRNLP